MKLKLINGIRRNVTNEVRIETPRCNKKSNNRYK